MCGAAYLYTNISKSATGRQTDEREVVPMYLIFPYHQNNRTILQILGLNTCNYYMPTKFRFFIYVARIQYFSISAFHSVTVMDDVFTASSANGQPCLQNCRFAISKMVTQTKEIVSFHISYKW